MQKVAECGSFAIFLSFLIHADSNAPGVLDPRMSRMMTYNLFAASSVVV